MAAAAAALAGLAAAVCAAAPSEPVHAIANEEAARKLCAATAPAARSSKDPRDPPGPGRRELLKTEFEATVSLSQLELADVDEAEREVTLRRRDLLRPGLGVNLFMEEQELVLTAAAAAAVPAGGAQPLVRRVTALGKQQKALLRLRYRLADVDGAGPCRLGAKPGSPPVLTIEPQLWELFDETGALFASGGVDAAGERRAPAGGQPAVTVAPATVDGAGPPAGEITERARKEEPRLRDCYAAALALDPTVDGSLVLEVAIGADGKAKEVTTTADSVHDAALASCATRLLGAVSWGKGGPSSALIPVHFERK